MDALCRLIEINIVAPTYFPATPVSHLHNHTYIGALADDELKGQVNSLVKSLRSKYDGLPQSGKFATGAAVGFGTSRVAVKGAVSFVKIAGAAFVTTEVMNAVGKTRFESAIGIMCSDFFLFVHDH